MILQEPVDQQLSAEIERVGGGYLRLDASAAQDTCKLFVHEGSEVNPAARGVISWHEWDGGTFGKSALLDVLRTWPTFDGQSLDGRVGVWFKRYRRQKNRKTGDIRWKDLGVGGGFYPQIFPWHDLQRLEGGAAT